MSLEWEDEGSLSGEVDVWTDGWMFRGLTDETAG